MLLDRLGRSFFSFCLETHYHELLSIGNNLETFFNGLDNYHRHIMSRCENARHGVYPLLSYRCASQEAGGSDDRLTLYVKGAYPDNLVHIVSGIARCIADKLFDSVLELTPLTRLNHDVMAISILVKHRKMAVGNLQSSCQPTLSLRSKLSGRAEDSRISVPTLCRTFPFYVIFDRDVRITQLGSALLKMVAPTIKRTGLFLGNYFTILRPDLPFSFEAILDHTNRRFELKCDTHTTEPFEKHKQVGIWSPLVLQGDSNG